MNAARMLLKLEKAGNSAPLMTDYRAYSALLSLIKKRDASFADHLHDLPVKAVNAALRPEKGYAVMDMTALSRPVSEQLYSCLADAVAGGERLWIGNATFKLAAVVPASPGDDAGDYGFFEFDENIEISRKFSIDFQSPCAFKNGTLVELFPAPWLVFNSLINKWNYFSEHKIESFSRGNVERDFYVSKYDLKTLHIKAALGEKRGFTGFTGSCSYEISKKAPEEFALAVNMLMRFAPFAGLGKSAAMGMGRVGIKF